MVAKYNNNNNDDDDKNSIEIKNSINNTSANMLKTVQRRGNCINYGLTHYNILTLLVALIQTVSLFANFDVPGSVVSSPAFFSL